MLRPPHAAARRSARLAAVVATAAFAGACAPRRAPEPRPTPSASPAPRPVAPPVPVTTFDLDFLRVRWLMVPVAGVAPSSVADAFLDGRVGHVHHAVDIMAPRGTPVLSADDGRVLRVRSNALGGLTIYAVDDEERFVYYYAHLDRYAPTLAEGARVAKGQLIGYVGTTGNAPPNAPHLHFQVMRLAQAGRWWDGPPIDPRPYLAIPGVRR